MERKPLTETYKPEQNEKLALGTYKPSATSANGSTAKPPHLPKTVSAIAPSKKQE